MKYILLTLVTAIFASSGVFLAGGTSSCNLKENHAQSQPDTENTPPGKVASTLPTYDDREFDGEPLIRSDADWKRSLTPAQYYILRQAGTEQPYTGEYADDHEHGIYYSAACGLALFKSETKFESGTGWPSFYQPIFPKNVIERKDTSLPEEIRTEILYHEMP